MLYLAKVPDSVRFLESRFEEIAEKTDTIDTVASRVEGLPIQELLARVDTLEGNIGRTVNYEYGDSSSGFVAHMEEHTEPHNASNANQAPAGGAILVSIVEIPEPKPFCAARDAKGLKPWAKTKLYEQKVQDLTSAYAATERLSNLISDSQDVRRHQSSSPQRNRNSRSSSSKAVGGDKHSDDKSNQVEGEVNQIEGGEKPRIKALKYLSSLQKKSQERNVPTERGLLGKSQTSKAPLGEGLRKNEGREFCCPTYRRTSEMNDDKVGRALETVPKDTLCVPEKCHGVMPNSWPKSLSMQRRTHHGIESPSEVKALAKNAYRTTPPELAVSRKQLKKLLGTEVSRPVQAPYGSSILSLKKDRNSQRHIKHSILNKLIASRKYPFSLLSNLFDRSCGVKYFLKSDIRSRYCRVRETKGEGLETTYVTGLRAYEFSVAPFSLTDAMGGKFCSLQRQINVLGHLVEFHQIEVEKRKIVATCDERIPKLVIELRPCLELANSNEQFTDGFLQRGTSSLTELLKEEDIQWGPSLGVPDATKPPKVEAEQFNCMLEEYLHHLVDGRQKNWVQLLNVAQFSHSAQTDSLIKRSQFETKGSRHFVLPPLTYGPYVGNNPQVHRVEKKWDQMADIARVCLEEASRPMKEREEDRVVKEVLAGRVRADRRPTREIHKFLVKWKNPLVEVTSGEHVEDLEASKQKTEELQASPVDKHVNHLGLISSLGYFFQFRGAEP
ncbi:RNA-directed DNA polymerase-like protein [Cucumis melo var. makuwa]|uniref:RNA-directed DNA polymerase-like protein n=1 Tax=Cucumis melo var. makuwa TaxID=1194695 RepID=A0A5D3CIQ1_CUCMM|nr:RNA-directed DNA polymerase-like protein [Cucumis melo var. makuwa]